jgi:hypothetical protein
MEIPFVSPRSGRRSVLIALKKSRDKELSSSSHSMESNLSRGSQGSRKVLYRRPDGKTGVSTTDFFQKAIEVSDHRKTDISESLQNLNLHGSFRDNKPSLIQKVTAYDLYDVGDDDSQSANILDSEEFDVGEEPQSCHYLMINDGPSSVPTQDNNPSVIQTSASDEQWASFKLLGRVGLGDFTVSKPAKKLINKNIRVLTKALKQVMGLRDADAKPMDTTFDVRTGKLLDEVKVTLDVPASKEEYKRDPATIVLEKDVEKQLKDYVTVISCMYRDIGFHNFEHASQVLKSANKILSFISISEGNDNLDMGDGSGVITDPWTHFALIFSALVHDVDHAGVSNAQLIKERSIIAGSYNNKNVAEQNSIDIAWNLLMEPFYRELREALFMSPEEVSRFRRLVVIFVMATDIADKELANLRKDRAQQALECEQRTDDIVSRKATYVMETIMQAADVSHTMQPFPIFKKWNHMLYREMYSAFQKGRAENDPTETWYRGDIGFFDFYIIPLAKKLVNCGVLDQRKAENLLNNAVANRNEWEKHGEEIVAQYIAERTAVKGPRSRGRSMDSKASFLSGMTDSGFSPDGVSLSHEEQLSQDRIESKSSKRIEKPSSFKGSNKKPSSFSSRGSKRSKKRDKDMPFTDLPLNDSQDEDILPVSSERKARNKSSKKKGQHENGVSKTSEDGVNGMTKVHSEGNLLGSTGLVLPTRSKRRGKSMSKADKAENQVFLERIRGAKEANQDGSSRLKTRPRGSSTMAKTRSSSTGALDKKKRDTFLQQQGLVVG